MATTDIGWSVANPRLAVIVKTKVATRMPRTVWTIQSRANSRNNRGENCCEASYSAATVSEKVSVVNVIPELAISWSAVAADFESPGQSSFSTVPREVGRTRSKAIAKKNAPTAATDGHNHNEQRAESESRLLRSALMTEDLPN